MNRLPIALASALLFALTACNSGSPDGSGGAGDTSDDHSTGQSTASGDDATNWVYCTYQDNDGNTICTGYATTGVDLSSQFKAQCTAMNGGAVVSACPTEGLVGDCVMTTTAGGFSEETDLYWYGAGAPKGYETMGSSVAEGACTGKWTSK